VEAVARSSEQQAAVSRPRVLRAVAVRCGAALLALLALATLIASCGGDDRGRSTLVIGDLVPLRGDLAEFGVAGRKSVNLAVAQARAAGSGTSIRVRHADTESDRQIAEIVARRLADDEDAGCLVGDWAASGTFAIGADVAATESVPLISPASTSTELSALDDRDFVFRTAPSDVLQAQALARLMARSIGNRGRTVSIAARGDAYGQRFAETFRQAWAGLGGRSREPLLYNAGRLQRRADARRIVAGNPNAYLLIDFPDSFARLAPALLAEPGFRPDRLFFPDAMATDDVRDHDIAPAAVEGARGTLPGATAPSPEGRFFERLYAGSPEPPHRQPGFDAEAFDAVTLCFLAAVAAGSSEGEAIADRLEAVSAPPGARFGPEELAGAVRALHAGEDIDYQGASGPIDFDANGDPQAAAFEAFSYHDGRLRRGPAFLARRNP
jgi:ABC-type branched-subunit amino acid transport system substrate-binding protein